MMTRRVLEKIVRLSRFVARRLRGSRWHPSQATVMPRPVQLHFKLLGSRSAVHTAHERNR